LGTSRQWSLLLCLGNNTTLKVVEFQLENALRELVWIGYEETRGGAILKDKKGRFHAIITGKNNHIIKLHYDTLKGNFHAVFPDAPKLTAEKYRIKKNSKIHMVTKNEDCYYCQRCFKASGDGEGFIGKKCNGI
jgi:hypothetical protein